MLNPLAKFISEATQKGLFSRVTSIHKIQSLWSNYGGIYRLKVSGGSYPTIVVKQIDLKPSESHPRGWAGETSHNRKVRSYAVETYWYTHYAHQIPHEIKVPQLLESYRDPQQQFLVMEDLQPAFPEIKSHCNFSETQLVLSWLAKFHAHFLGTQPQGLWETGSYWHLETRRNEWEAMKKGPLKEKAQEIDNRLKHAKFQTLIHGDAKVANFCFSPSGDAVAAVDFQYVGQGVGVKDVAYFLGSCLTSADCQLYENALLDHYFQELSGALKPLNPTQVEALEKEWRYLYPLAWADFNRFLLGWQPTHHKLHFHAMEKNEIALESLWE